MNINALTDLMQRFEIWSPPVLTGPIPHGDMPEDKVQITPEHITKANTIFPILLPMAAQNARGGRVVIAVCGGSGVGKSEIASLLSYYFRCAGVNSYTLSGDNYPRRIPSYNDAERIRIFRTAGLHGLLNSGCYNAVVKKALAELWQLEKDADPVVVLEYPWLDIYQNYGRNALADYLGTNAELDYEELNHIISEFHTGKNILWLKRMGRSEEALWYDAVDMSDTNVLVIEWTHGNSEYLHGVDIPILLDSTPEQTRLHRLLRGRDGKTDSAFTTMVLEIEQRELDKCAEKAKIIIAKTGERISYAKYSAERKA